MFILIKDEHKLIRINLEVSELPFIYKDIEIYRDDDFYIRLNGNSLFSSLDKVKRIETTKYIVNNDDKQIEIYCYSCLSGIDDFRLYKKCNFVYACNQKANIINKDELLRNYYLYYKDNKLYTNYYPLIVNDRNYNNEDIKDGDEVKMHNLRIFFVNGMLYINNFMIDNRLELADIKEKVIKHEKRKIRINNIYLQNKKELIIDDIKEYKEVTKQKSKKIIYQIGPGLMMALATLSFSIVNVYKNHLENRPLIDSLVYIIMPITMLISSILWPMLNNHNDNKEYLNDKKKNEDKYFDYLLKYEDNVKKKIDNYIKQEEDFYYDGIDENRLFSLTSISDRFLNISLGKSTISTNKVIPYSGNKKIDKKLKQISIVINKIENCPCYLDIRQYKSISFVSTKNVKNILVKRFLLELSSKYNIDDFNIGLYSENINQFSDLFSLPQLILNNSRLILNKKRDIQEINNYKLNKLLILFIVDKVDYHITNENIYVLYFSSDINDLYKNSELLIEYKKDIGIIHNKDNIQFKYDLNICDYKKDCELLGLYQKIGINNKVITFSDIYKDFNIDKYYNDPQIGLRADFALVGNELLSFDLHESKQGPHGLIGGSTGSGKSELIISLLLSLCIRYRPDYLNIILIDYKGGGIKDSLSYKGKCVPHIVASIDNLETNAFERLIILIEKECYRRQILFKELSNKAMVSIMNIDDYLDNDYKKYGLEDIAHLLIVVDEFAELKKENPELIKKLISFSRIGRSLGLHLILATQRPSGNIDEEIWSNSHFKIALKVFSDKDSNDIIKNNKAAYLSNKGEFYLTYDDNLIKANSIYSKSDINNKDKYEVCLLDNRLNTIKKKTLINSDGQSEASYISSKIIEASNELNIQTKDFDIKVPEILKREELSTKYQNAKGIILGQKDDYLNGKIDILDYDDKENILIYSTRNNEINNILNSIKRRMVVISFKKYENKYISDSLLYDEAEDILFLFKKMLNDNADICVVIEDISCLLSYNDSFNDYLYQLLRRSNSTNYNFIVLSKQSNLNIKLLNCFNNKVIINANDDQDVLNIFSSRSEYKGKSFYYDQKVISFVPCVIEEFKSGVCFINPYVKKIPDIIKYKTSKKGLLVGFDKTTRKEIYLQTNDKLLITSLDNTIIDKLSKLFINDHNIFVKQYDKSLLNSDINRYLWVGEGLYSQRLFYVEGKGELDKKDAYYYKDNIGSKIRLIDYEQDYN